MWENDGQAIISQRKAPFETMPTLDSNPPRIATVADSLTSLSGNDSTFAFTIPANGDTKQWVIFAYGSESPGSSANDARISQHWEHDTVQIDLSGGSSTPNPNAPSDKTPSGGDPSDDIPLLPYQRMIIAHAIFSVVGFLLFLPAGALVARYVRTFTPKWFVGHWFFQFCIAGPTITAGVALGIASINKSYAIHLNDTHKQLGAALFALYIIQVIFGAIIHWVKPKNTSRRPIQNYGHAVLGLLTIALAMYQVYTGFTVEWPKTTGRGVFPNGVNILFYIWVSIVAVLYFGGLALLPRQFKQESQPKRLPVRDYDEEYRDRD